MAREDERIGWPGLVWFGLVVAAFMVLSLAVTATGTARFAVAMGYDANIGYAVGGIFDLAKGVILVAVLSLCTRRALGIATVLGRHGSASSSLAGLQRTPR